MKLWGTSLTVFLVVLGFELRALSEGQVLCHLRHSSPLFILVVFLTGSCVFSRP
jgi:hypothetical protein